MVYGRLEVYAFCHQNLVPFAPVQPDVVPAVQQPGGPEVSEKRVHTVSVGGVEHARGLQPALPHALDVLDRVHGDGGDALHVEEGAIGVLLARVHEPLLARDLRTHDHLSARLQLFSQHGIRLHTI